MTTGGLELASLRIALRAPDGLTLRSDPNYLLLAALYRAIDTVPAIPSARKRWLHTGQPKSFTLSPIMVSGAGTTEQLLTSLATVPTGTRLWVRLSTLEVATLEALLRALTSIREGAPLALDHQPVQVEGWSLLPPTRQTEPSATTTYARLFAAAQSASEVALRFLSPFAILSGRDVVPPARLGTRHFFGGYLQHWRAFAPRDLDAIPKDAVLAAVHLLPPTGVHPAPLPNRPSKAPPMAYQGVVRFRVEADPEVAKWVATLADYAWFCGTGAATAWGLGQTERASLTASPIAEETDAPR